MPATPSSTLGGHSEVGADRTCTDGATHVSPKTRGVKQETVGTTPITVGGNLITTGTTPLASGGGRETLIGMNYASNGRRET